MSVSTRILVGVSPLSWTNDVLADLGGDIPLETCLEEAAAAGYEGIELGRKFPGTINTLQPILSNAKLKLASGWFNGFLAEHSVEEELEAVHNHALLLKSLGAKVMVYGECGVMPGNSPLDEPLSLSPALGSINLEQYAQKVNSLAASLLKTYGLRLAYHHHLMMIVETNDELKAFLEATDDVVGIVLDCGHATTAGIDISWVLENYGNRVAHIHMKDVRGNVLNNVINNDWSFNNAVRNGLFTIPGDGIVDYTPVINFLKQSNYSGWIIIEAEQDPVKAPPLETVKKARAWVKNEIGI
ncbi:myo-inosose-2 dehydratase (plasmid) [Pantoea alfalfae]|uniref:myo-inosose-2 dehydratase n=1 Tax=Pantoea alfalfae TaxID=3074822 RepID=UPI001CA409F2|nr:myo-inosose-2 dehydratase [Pantoea alfalfae]QZX97579.1 myo-inosose-2 dehydratase [Pantoea alfalfae]